jgi:hypothetical protein
LALIAEGARAYRNASGERAQPMVGILNSTPARMPVGQREVTAFCLV